MSHISHGSFRYSLGIVSFTIFVFSYLPLISFAQNGMITVKTDSPTYNSGQPVLITGTVPSFNLGSTIGIQVYNPAGATYKSEFVTPNSAGLYSYNLLLGGPLATVGNYVVKVTYSDQSAQTSFQLTSPQSDLVWLSNSPKFFKAESSESPISPTVGQPFLIAVDSLNNGTAPAKINATFQLLDSAGKPVYDNWVATNWEPGAKVNIAVSALVSKAGLYKFVATLDSSNEVTELNEENNVLISIVEIGTGGKLLKFEPGTSVFGIEVDNKIFDLVIKGEGISSIVFNQNAKNLMLENDGSGGVVELKIPVELLGGNFTLFADDGKRIDYRVEESEAQATLIFEKPANSTTITLHGTNVIPEFGEASLLVYSLVLLGVIAMIFITSHTRPGAARYGF